MMFLSVLIIFFLLVFLSVLIVLGFCVNGFSLSIIVRTASLCSFANRSNWIGPFLSWFIAICGCSVNPMDGNGK